MIHHAPNGSLSALAEAVVAGTVDEAIVGVEVEVADPLTVSVEQVLAADAYLLGTAAHFGYMSGALKHFFDQTFLQIGGALDDSAAPRQATVSDRASTAGRPYGLWLHGRYDLTGARTSVESITSALRWRRIAPILEVIGEVDDTARESAYELGATLAAHLIA